MITADTITDEQIRELHKSLEGDLAALSTSKEYWTSHLRKALVETEWALCAGEPIRRSLARARCAVILNARAKEQR